MSDPNDLMSDDDSQFSKDVDDAGEELLGDEATITVQKVYESSKVIIADEMTSEPIQIKPFRTAVARVGHSTGLTINLGNYESAKVGVFCVLPTYVEELDEAYEAAKKFAETRLTREAEEIREWVKSKRASSGA